MAKRRRTQPGQSQLEFKPSPESYWRAATARFETATYLLENSKRYSDTVYIGGYAVECALKALILKRTPESDLDAVIDDISTGAISHNFDSLSHRLRSRNVDIPKDVRRSLLFLSERWSTDLRYSGHMTKERPAREFIQHIESVLNWVRRSL